MVTSCGNAARSSLRYLSLSRGTSMPSSGNLGRQMSSNALTSSVCCISGEYALTRFIIFLQSLENDAQISSRDFSRSIAHVNHKYGLKFFHMKERTSRKFGTVRKYTIFGAILSISPHSSPVACSKIFSLLLALLACTLGSKAGPKYGICVCGGGESMRVSPRPRAMKNGNMHLSSSPEYTQ